MTELLPAPFAWCDIPEGYVTIEAQRVLVPAFKIAKYLITYAQFEVFINALDGYANAAWWQGFAQRDEAPGEQKWKIANHPRENVHWYDAMAYCRWLSHKTQTTITLPTESQWQRAAQGDDGRKYPWGNDFDEVRCNSGESDPDQTTPVDAYPAGASPYGALDMLGNVWEWCLSSRARPYRHPENTDPSAVAARCWRGGSWDVTQDFIYVEYRYFVHQLARFDNIGFRVVCIESPP
jgi:formylglycine-generating enzyme required for sulfatase activity